MLAIGNASMRADDLASAEKAYIQAFETYHQIGNKADESNSLMSLGNVHLSQRDFYRGRSGRLSQIEAFSPGRSETLEASQ